MKTKEELNQIKEEYVELNQKLAELTEEETEKVVGGLSFCFFRGRGDCNNCVVYDCARRKS